MASASYAVSMGSGITANESQSVANSGDYYGANYFFNAGDARLLANVTDADTSQLLANVNRLRVVEHAVSENLCKHKGRDHAECAKDRTVGLKQPPGLSGGSCCATAAPPRPRRSTSSACRSTPPIGR